jgi:hypothetical protein
MIMIDEESFRGRILTSADRAYASLLRNQSVILID